MLARLVPSLPIARPLASTSPGLASEMRKCLLRVAFRSSDAHRALAATSPLALLGLTCHSLLERVERGALAGEPGPLWPQRVAELWDEILVQTCTAHPLARELGDPQRWPYYHLRRAQALRLALSIAKARSESVASGDGRGSRPYVEWRMTGSAGRMQGR